MKNMLAAVAVTLLIFLKLTLFAQEKATGLNFLKNKYHYDLFEEKESEHLTFSKDEQEQLDSIISIQRDPFGESYRIRQVFTYDDEKRITGNARYIWNSSSALWELLSYLSYSYNEFDLLKEKIELRLSGGTILSSSQRLLYNYNDEELEDSIVRLTWDTDSTDWKLAYLQTNEYNAEGLLKQRSNFSWDEELSVWAYRNKFEYSYNAQGAQAQILIYKEDRGDLLLDSRSTFTYDSDGNLIYYDSDTWNSDVNIWSQAYTEEIIYNENGARTQFKSLFWQADKDDWFLLNLYDYFYDELGNPTKVELLDAPFVGAQTIKKEVLYSYDENVELADVITAPIKSATSVFDVPMVNKPLIRRRYEFDGPDKSLTEKAQFYYSKPTLTSATKLQGSSSFEISPNPFDGILVIEANENEPAYFELFDASGRRVMSRTINAGKHQIDLQHLPKGMYHCSFRNSTGRWAERLSKQ